jgi:hypothetical protein
VTVVVASNLQHAWAFRPDKSVVAAFSLGIAGEGDAVDHDYRVRHGLAGKGEGQSRKKKSGSGHIENVDGLGVGLEKSKVGILHWRILLSRKGSNLRRAFVD